MSDTQIEKRLLTLREAAEYTSRGETQCRQWLRQIGAARHFGRTVRYDIRVIDKVLDEMALETEKEK